MPRLLLLWAVCLAFLTPAADAAAQETTPWCEADLAGPASSRRSLACVLAPDGDAAFSPWSGDGGGAAVDAGAAARAWRTVQDVLAASEPDPVAIADALVALETLRAFAPELSDRIALFGAELEHALGRARSTCDRYAEAIQSPLSSVAARARVGHVRCLLDTGSRRGEDALLALERRYHDLPMQTALHLSLGEALEGWGRTHDAIDEYRTIDLEHPGSVEGRIARERLLGLAARGVRVRALSPTQEVERAERLVRSGPPDLARTEIERLRGVALSAPLAAEVALLAARLARVEGRFEDAHALMREARGLVPGVGEDPAAVETVADDLAEAAAARDQDEARSALRRLGFGRSLRRQSATRLYLMARTAARAGMQDELHTIVDEELRRVDRDEEAESCIVRFDLAIVASGTADDERVARLLAGCEGTDARGVAARYHRARALERLGRVREARRELRAVMRDDPSDTEFYALWAETRLSALDAAPPENPFDDGAVDGTEGIDEAAAELGAPGFGASALHLALAGHAVEGSRLTWNGVPWSLDGGKTGDAVPVALDPAPAPPAPAPAPTAPVAEPDAAIEVEADVDDAPVEPTVAMTDEAITTALEHLAAEHGEAFVWLARARALVRLGARADAAEELFFVYEAAREADGHAPLRSGLEAVYRGDAPARLPTSLPLRRARRALSLADRQTLADIAAALGDFGLSTRFGGPGRAAARPRPFEPVVRAAAARHGVDPNLLWAVMRVESVYNPGIVSYAGAIGLMQIMPRTGRNIAHRLGLDGFTPADLLDPETNIELSAWYLASLLERFEGRIPLAVAAYNGGPHNVRRWMEDHGRDLPVDALCERIPFDQTFRYVRRVLHHYAAYRAMDGLPLPALEPTLPGASIDHVAF